MLLPVKHSGQRRGRLAGHRGTTKPSCTLGGPPAALPSEVSALWGPGLAGQAPGGRRLWGRKVL